MNITNELHYPNTKCDLLTYCAYLGSIETEYRKFDLALWRSGNGKNFSITWIEGDEPEDYQSVGIIRDGKFIGDYITNYEFGGPLPVRECLALAVKHEWLKDNHIVSNMDIINKRYIKDNIIEYLCSAKENHKVTAIFKDSENVELDVVVHDRHIYNQYQLNGQEFNYDHIYMLEVPYEKPSV